MGLLAKKVVDFVAWMAAARAIKMRRHEAHKIIAARDTEYQNARADNGGVMTSGLWEDAATAAATVSKRAAADLAAIVTNARPACDEEERRLLAAAVESLQAAIDCQRKLENFYGGLNEFLREAEASPRTPIMLADLRVTA